MRILYYTSGTSGSGRVVRGLSIGNALRRCGAKAEYTILSSSPFAQLADTLGMAHVEIPPENEVLLSGENFAGSQLWQAITSLNPDIILVDLLWFTLHSFVHELDCCKIFLYSQVDERFFTMDLPGGSIRFRPDDFDRVIAVEPFDIDMPVELINPLVLRNRNEILTRRAAVEKLALDPGDRVCLFAFNGLPDEYERVLRSYSHLEKEGYRVVRSTNYRNGLFPVVDYFNAIDLVICSAGYNSFWEVMYFEKEAIFVPVERRFESQERRFNECRDYYFDENGADQLVNMILGM